MIEDDIGTIEIPLCSDQEVIAIAPENLPCVNEISSILQAEKCGIDIWRKIALAYYSEKKFDEFEEFIKSSPFYDDAMKNEMTHNNETDDFRRVMGLLDMLAAYWVECTFSTQHENDVKEVYMRDAKRILSYTDKPLSYKPSHVLIKAYSCFGAGDKLFHAESQFNFVCHLSSDKNSMAILGKAIVTFQRRDYEDALKILRQILQHCHKSPLEIRVLIGICLYKINRKKKAQTAFYRAIEMDEKNAFALVCNGIFLLNDGNEKNDSSNISNGMKLISHAYREDSSIPLILYHVTENFYRTKKIERVEVIRRLLVVAFRSTTNDKIKGECCYQLGRTHHHEGTDGSMKQALTYYTKSLNYIPKFYIVRFCIAQIFVYEKNYREAIKNLESVVENVGDDLDAKKLLAILYVHERADSKKEDGRRRQKSIEYMREVCEKCPNDIDAWINYAQMLDAHTETKLVLDAYTQASKLIREKNVLVPLEMLNNIASLYYKEKQYGECDTLLKVAIDQLMNYDKKLEYELDNVNSKNENWYNGIRLILLYNQGRLYETMNRLNEAKKIYLSLKEEYPTYIDVYLRLAQLSLRFGDRTEAINNLNSILKLNPKHVDAQLLLAELDLEKVNPMGAKSKYEIILNNRKSCNDCYTKLALANLYLTKAQSYLHEYYQKYHLNQMEPERIHRSKLLMESLDKVRNHALRLFRDVIEYDPFNIYAANGIACVLATKNMYNEARDIFSQVRESTSIFPDVWMNIAHVLTEQHQYKTAIQTYESCIKRFYSNNRCAPVHLLLSCSRAYFKEGIYSSCLKLLQLIRMLYPKNIEAVYNIHVCQRLLIIQRLHDHEGCTEKKANQFIDTLKNSEKYIERLYRSHLEINRSIVKFEIGQFRSNIQNTNNLIQSAVRVYSINQERIKNMKKGIRDVEMKKFEEEQERHQEKKQREVELSLQRKELQEKLKEVDTKLEEDTEERKKESKKKKEKKKKSSNKKKQSEFIENDDVNLDEILPEINEDDDGEEEKKKIDEKDDDDDGDDDDDDDDEEDVDQMMLHLQNNDQELASNNPLNLPSDEENKLDEKTEKDSKKKKKKKTKHENETEEERRERRRKKKEKKKKHHHHHHHHHDEIDESNDDISEENHSDGENKKKKKKKKSKKRKINDGNQNDNESGADGEEIDPTNNDEEELF
ncbi:hypothetical protein SNEBB_003603 [Seison nebaliae]|nr:hypothetical protein SNEBB_003603 [Seison nebaliae]